MDNFMDKLAQKLTAQEMINANSAADAEEMRQLKGQLMEYNACIAKLQETNNEIKATNDQLGRLVSESITPEINRLISESAAMIEKAAAEGSSKLEKAAADGSGKLEKAAADGSGKLEKVAADGTRKLEKAAADGSSKLESAKVDTAEIEKLVQESKEKIQQIAEESLKKIEDIQAANNDDSTDELKQSISDKLDGSNDYVHRECVKVYRNVQAVVVEESAKNADKLDETSKLLTKKVKLVLVFSIAGFAAGFISLILNILSAVGVF